MQRGLPSKRRIATRCPNCKNVVEYNPPGATDRFEYIFELSEDERKFNCTICRTEIILPSIIPGYEKN